MTNDESIATCLKLIEEYEQAIASFDRELLEVAQDLSHADSADKRRVRNRLVGERGNAIEACAALRVRVRALRLEQKQQ